MAGVELGTQDSRPRTQRKSVAKDCPSEDDRSSRGQGQECSRPSPKTQAQVFSKIKWSSKFFKKDAFPVLQHRNNIDLQKRKTPKDLKRKRKKRKSPKEKRPPKADLQKRKTKKVFANFPRGFWCFTTKF